MARRQYKGGAPPLALSGDIAASGVATINTTGTVSSWPDGSTGKFLIVIDKGNAGEEKIYCDARTGNALSVASDSDRGADGTAAASHVSGVTVNHCGGAIDLDEPNAHINTTSQDDHTQYLLTDGTRSPTGITNIAATPGSSAPGDVAAKGSGPTLALSDHKHGREALQVVNLSNVASVTATGTEIDLQSLTIPSNTLKAGSLIHVYNTGSFINCTTGTGSVSYSLLFNGSGDSGGISLDGTNNERPFAVWSTLAVISIGSSGTIRYVPGSFANFYLSDDFGFGGDGFTATVNTTTTITLKTHGQALGTGASVTSLTLNAVIFV